MVNIILDLDETLIRTITITTKYDKQLEKNTDFYFTITNTIENITTTYYYWVIKRPGLELFLSFIFKYFNIGIWTAGDKEYAKNICKNILTLPHLKKIKFIYSRQFCHKEENECKEPFYTKPLSKIYDLYPTFNKTNTLIIDNTSNVMKYNVKNGVNIPDYLGDPNDDYLYHIRNILICFYKENPMDTPITPLVEQLNKNLIKMKKKQNPANKK